MKSADYFGNNPADSKTQTHRPTDRSQKEHQNITSSNKVGGGDDTAKFCPKKSKRPSCWTVNLDDNLQITLPNVAILHVVNTY